ESISRGTIDGGLMAYGTAVAYRLPGLVKSGTTGENFGSGAITYTISLAKWKALPENVRKVFDQVGESVTRKACETITKGVEADMAKLKEGGVALVKLPASDRDTVDRALSGVAEEWAKDLDARNLDGTPVLAAFRNALK
ncbi:MAG: C4-dicarboxylate ABC transporter, partial [Lysobacteraceae bacterium]